MRRLKQIAANIPGRSAEAKAEAERKVDATERRNRKGCEEQLEQYRMDDWQALNLKFSHVSF